MRPILLTALALLAACAPPAPPASPPPAAPTEAGPLAAQLAAATAAIGRWSYRSDEGVSSACFGAPESECQFSIQCEAPTQTLTLIVDAELTPDQDALIQIYDAQGSMTLFSRSHNEGLPSVIAEIGPDSLDRLGLLELLSTAPPRFAVETRALNGPAGDLVDYPWDDSITRVLTACR